MTASPMAGTHYLEKWVEYIRLMTESKTLQQVSDALNIHISTAFNWRHKVLNNSFDK
jgi:transposase-like protein